MKERRYGDENGMCILDETIRCDNCKECDRCDLDPNKICDNCGKCLDEYNTDEKGFLKVGIDKIMMGEGSDLESFYTMAGLDDDDDECDCCDHNHHDHDCNCGCHDD